MRSVCVVQRFIAGSLQRLDVAGGSEVIAGLHRVSARGPAHPWTRDGLSMELRYLVVMATVHAPELLIVMSGTATPEEVEHVVARLEEVGAQAHVTPGKQATVIGAIGERELIASLPLEGYAGVEQVLPILKPYKLVSREIFTRPDRHRRARPSDRRRLLRLRGGAVHRGEPRADARHRARSRGRRLHDAARRRIQTAVVAVHLPGARPRRAWRSWRRRGRRRACPSLRNSWTRRPRPGRRDGGRDPDRRAEHAELLPAAYVGETRHPVLLKRGPAETVTKLLSRGIRLPPGPALILCERGINTFETSTRYTMDISASRS